MAKDASPRFIEDELRAEGFLSGDAESSVKSVAEALERFQRTYGLEATGVLDDETLAILRMPSCGNVDAGLFKESFAVGWPRRDLTFGFRNACPTLTPAQTRTATLATFAEWAGVVTLRFTEAASAASADIKIGWFSGEHGEGLAHLRFDGRVQPNGTGREFGHGFPPNSPLFPGEAHMDADENWTVGNLQVGNADLQTVVLHEIGHALGIEHIPDSTAVMFRRFPLDRVKRKLTAKDIDAIRVLYP